MLLASCALRIKHVNFPAKSLKLEAPGAIPCRTFCLLLASKSEKPSNTESHLPGWTANSNSTITNNQEQLMSASGSLSSPLFDAEIQAFIASLRPLYNTRCFELACLVLLVLDYFITFGKEVEFFWRGAWTLSRILFFLNRYLPLGIMGLTTILFFATELSIRVCPFFVQFLSHHISYVQICDAGIRASFTLTVIAVSINQAILLLRVWHMFPRNSFVRLSACASFLGCTSATFATLFLSFGNLHSVPIPQVLAGQFVGCTSPPPANIWKIFIPNIVIHTVLFGFMVMRAMDGSWGVRESAPLMRRMLREGTFIYLLAMVSVCFSAAGARMTDYPLINVPATFSNFSLTINSLAVSRLMFSIRSLAGKLQTDPRWLLNPTELNRVNWHVAEGRFGGEIVVEMVTCEPDSKGPASGGTFL
ncbi:hypothetical protein BJ138DRAFT_1069691 [Hygrophoropsis aurantiaca]|uniref:Uncharacterized protein n=1 Tax=Hygrophoropsis aurantiaca TaxID=72124 RepID=A0ACB8A487_9AGAM|nr:hypothetical protein BJ138DRAFT_1069691 [Hygrophoropsis aurantiaca]